MMAQLWKNAQGSGENQERGIPHPPAVGGQWEAVLTWVASFCIRTESQDRNDFIEVLVWLSPLAAQV